MRLLVVEDEARLAAALRRGLVAQGFQVDVEMTGPAGLEAARFVDYDAVLLDIMLPGLSGYEVVRQLRAEDRWLPVLLISAKDGEFDQVDGLDCGADDYLVKPFSFVVLLARLRAVLRRGRMARPALLTVGEVELDPASRQVRRNGEVVSLTVKEYQLAEFLMRNADRVVGKTELLEHVWEDWETLAPNVVEVYVGYLRRKLGATAVVTVRGAGYRMAP